MSLKKYFLQRIQLQTEKVWFDWRRIEKNQIFSIIFVKIDANHLSLTMGFSNLLQKKLHLGVIQ